MEQINEIKRMQQLAGISISLQEADSKEEPKSSALPPEVKAAASVFDLKALKSQAEEKAKETNEVMDPLSWIGIVLAIPALLQGLATLIEKANRKFKGLSKEEIEKLKAHNIAVAKGQIQGHKKYSSAFSKEVDEYAHWLHSMMVKPIEGVLWVISKIPFIGRIKYIKDEKSRHKLAEAVYLLVAILIGGWGLVHHAVGVTTAIDTAKLADVTVDTAALANASGVVSNRDFILKLVA